MAPDASLLEIGACALMRQRNLSTTGWSMGDVGLTVYKCFRYAKPIVSWLFAVRDPRPTWWWAASATATILPVNLHYSRYDEL